ncbi:hypothetical protein ACJZ2D_004901 [Fusarium nematophilum]
MDLEKFTEAARSSIDETVGYYQNITDRRVVSNVKPGDLRQLVPSKPPTEVEAWEDTAASTRRARSTLRAQFLEVSSMPSDFV